MPNINIEVDENTLYKFRMLKAKFKAKDNSHFLHILLKLAETIDPENCLTPEEVADVKKAWKEIERGETKKFTDIKEFLKDLKEVSKK